MEILFSLITLIGMGFAAVVGVRWMLRAGQMAQKREMPLAQTDLKVLEESANRLMTDLRAAADECVARIEIALAQAESRVRVIEQQSIPSQDQMHPTQTIEVPASVAFEPKPVGTADSTESAAQIARQSGMTTGEVELLRGLRQFGAR